jgi:hypothetical protein
MKIIPKLIENTEIQFNNWVYPGRSDLELEYRIEYIGHDADPFNTFSTSDEFVNAVSNSESFKITDDIDNKIGYRSRTIDQEELLDMIKGYRSYPEFRNEKTLQAIYDGFKNNLPMKMPIIMKFPNGRLKILAGNTRADVAIQLLGYYQAIILDVGNRQNENTLKIIPSITEDSDYTYLKTDNGNYRDKIDSDITTTEPVEDTLANTKSPTSDEIMNMRTRNNYWWSRSVGGSRINASRFISKKDLIEHYKKII